MTNPSVHNDDLRFLELLQQWLDGDFTRTDEQELEALAASDDFRRETLEGLRSEPEADYGAALDRLRSKLNEKRERRKGLIAWLPQLFAIAAGIAVLILVVLFFPARNQQSETQPVAQAPKSDLPVASVEPPQNLPEASPALGKAADKNLGKVISVPRGDALADRSDEKKELLANQSAAASQAAGNAEISVPPVPDSGILDEVVITRPKSKVAEVQKSSSASTIGNEVAKPAAAPARSVAEPPVAADDSESRRESAKSRNSGKKKATPAASGAPAPFQSGRPEMGWDAFKEYVTKHLRPVAEPADFSKSNKETLRFEVNPNGQPIRIQVISSLGTAYDAEAIRLVGEVKWSGPTVQADIYFPK